MPQTITYNEPDRIWLKDSDEKDMWTIDWSKWLKSDTIIASAWYEYDTTPTITLTDTNTTTTTTATISAGNNGQKYVLTNRITTTNGNIKEKKLIIQVLDTDCRRMT